MTSSDEFAEVDGVRLHYLDHGTQGRPPLLLLHGMAMHAHTFDGNARAWNDGFHVVALDQHGHGDSQHPVRAGDGSGAPADPAAYRTPVLAHQVLAFATAMGWPRFSIVGQSLGGHNGMYLAATVPERIDRLVISVDWSWCPTRVTVSGWTTRRFSSRRFGRSCSPSRGGARHRPAG